MKVLGNVASVLRDFLLDECQHGGQYVVTDREGRVQRWNDCNRNANCVEQGLAFHQTHYRSYRGRVFTGQMTQPTVSKH